MLNFVKCEECCAYEANKGSGLEDFCCQCLECEDCENKSNVGDLALHKVMLHGGIATNDCINWSQQEYYDYYNYDANFAKVEFAEEFFEETDLKPIDAI